MSNEAKIIYASGYCSLGSVLVAQTDSGVCAVLLGEEPESLIADLHERFRGAALEQAHNASTTALKRTIEAIDEPAAPHEIELDLVGTEFQQRVWAELRTIPAGETTSYRTIAERIGSPLAVRAVAGAIAANPVAVLIPCHRVVRSDGNLSGYRWGPERKRALLRREGALG